MKPIDMLEMRTRRLTESDMYAGNADYVLCWLMQALRAEENPTVDRAIALGNELGLPVVVLHALENRYPYASHRLHRFILEASRELEEGIEERGLRFVRWVRREGESEVDLVARLAERSAAVVVDDVPTFVTREYADGLARRLARPVLAVDACCSVPMNVFDTFIGTTKAFRAAHTKERELHLNTELHQEPEVARFSGELPMESEDLVKLGDDALDRLIEACGVDMSVPASTLFAGGRTAALKRLTFALEEVVPRYKWTRNNPALEHGTARISPWMHFGVLSPREIATAVLDREREGDLHPAARYKFLDETLTWREYYHHQLRHRPYYTSWEGLPSWARETMLEHAGDERPALLSLNQLIHGESDDETWNAGQKGFLLDGWMNNNLRMYWVKQILKWRQDPREAWAVACYLNDRLSLDGRDASTYGGIRWGFGDGRKGYREIDIYGWVSPKNSGALRRREGVPEWLAQEAARPTFQVALPDDESQALARYL